MLFSLQKGVFCYLWLFSYKGLNGGAKPALFPHNQGWALRIFRRSFLYLVAKILVIVYLYN